MQTGATLPMKWPAQVAGQQQAFSVLNNNVHKSNFVTGFCGVGDAAVCQEVDPRRPSLSLSGRVPSAFSGALRRHLMRNRLGDILGDQTHTHSSLPHTSPARWCFDFSHGRAGRKCVAGEGQFFAFYR